MTLTLIYGESNEEKTIHIQFWAKYAFILIEYNSFINTDYFGLKFTYSFDEFLLI